MPEDDWVSPITELEKTEDSRRGGGAIRNVQAKYIMFKICMPPRLRKSFPGFFVDTMEAIFGRTYLTEENICPDCLVEAQKKNFRVPRTVRQ
ncbi:MAG: hypothetical protein Ct9H300mP27_02080 [Chloroflexota bacterium]|nr:MAG: hypothetical protein Ct9H300mP27_02080 [Chloroflexota bacterium]